MFDPALSSIHDSPDFRVRVGGRELSLQATIDIVSVTVSTFVEGSDTFSMVLNNWDLERQELTWTERDLLKEGVEVEVLAGYGHSLVSLIVGEVTALEPEFPAGTTPTLTVRGHDRLHRLARGKKTHTFIRATDSQVAQKIAAGVGLRAMVDDSKTQHQYVMQRNQSDLEFLLERAKNIRYELKVKDKTLFFRRPKDDGDPVLTLKYGLTLQSFAPRLNTRKQVNKVEFNGWDPKKRERISVTTQVAAARSKGATPGATLTERVFPGAVETVDDRPVASLQEAEERSKARSRDLATDFVTGNGVAMGEPTLRAGVRIALTNVGKRFSGVYRVTSAEHQLSASGYNTSFSVERDAA